MQTVDTLIVGQGLAGSALAWRLAERGASFLVVDRGGIDDWGRPSASRVAAGLLTPITGKRLTLASGWEPMRSEAEGFYRGVERKTGEAFFHAAPSLRLLATEQEQQTLRRRSVESTYASQVQAATDDELPASLILGHSAFWMPTAARLDVRKFLRATRSWLEEIDAYRLAEVARDEDISWGDTGAVAPSLGVRANRVVLCQGVSATNPSRELAGRLEPAQGELLRIVAPGLNVESVVHRGVWLAPTLDGSHDQFLLGATYQWGDVDSTPTEAGRNELLTRLREFYDGPVEVVDHTAGVRPATPDRQPIAEFSPDNPRLAWFNGLGAKGALWAPWHAKKLASMLTASG